MVGEALRVGVYSTTSNTIAVTGNGDFLVQDLQGHLTASFGANQVYQAANNRKVVPVGSTILRITDMPQYNIFRGSIEVRFSIYSNLLWAVNELPLETYLKGIGEEPESRPHEFTKAAVVAYRSYALAAKRGHRHNLNEPFDISSSTEYVYYAGYDQWYIGYERETYGNNNTTAVDETSGEIATYQGNVATTFYFSQCDGHTRNLVDIWGSPDYPYCVSVADPWCEGNTLQAHGVGMCMNGGAILAGQGYTYHQILQHYYTGIGFNTYEASIPIINNPYKGYVYNYRGNLHAHSNNGGGGTESPAVVGTWYKNNGYAFYTITDHDVVTSNPGVPGILWLGGGEEDSYDGSSGHIGHHGITISITSGVDQARVDSTLAQGGFTVIHHPARADYAGWTVPEINALNGILGLEIFNGGSDLDSTAIWDSVLTGGKLVWGTASDDSHSAGAHGDGYIVVNSSSASPTAGEIKSQMQAGNFYASRGCDLVLTVTNQTITATTTNGSSIRWVKQSGTIIKTTNAAIDSYNAVGNEGYIRIEVLDGSSSPRAWSQPLIVTNSP